MPSDKMPRPLFAPMSEMIFPWGSWRLGGSLPGFMFFLLCVLCGYGLAHRATRRNRPHRLHPIAAHAVQLIDHVADYATMVRNDVNDIADGGSPLHALKSMTPCSSDSCLICASGNSITWPYPVTVY